MDKEEKKISEFNESMLQIQRLHKSPESWVGRKLTEFNLKSVRKGSGKFYNLSKSIVKNIIDRYFPLSTNKDTQHTLHTLHTQDTEDTSNNNEPCVSSVVPQEVEDTIREEIRLFKEEQEKKA
jgi:hypothetical protein